MKYTLITLISFLMLFIIGCDSTPISEEEEEEEEEKIEIVESISMETVRLRHYSVILETRVRFKEDFLVDKLSGYDLYISTEEDPDSSSMIDFFDDTFRSGLINFDHEENESLIINPIYELKPNTEYYYRLILYYHPVENNEIQKVETPVKQFTTEEENFENGGIVYYDKGEYSDGWRYLVAAPPGWYNGSDSDPAAVWGCFGQLVGTTDSEFGSGLVNTQKIIEQNCEGADDQLIASDLANNLELNGFDDWYLPSKDEITRLIRFKDAALEIFEYGVNYWSSTEWDSTQAISATNTLSNIEYSEKSRQILVRPIRRY